MTPRSVTIEYIRPGKETSYFEEDLLLENDDVLKTFKRLPEEVAAHLTQHLREGNYITNDQRCVYIRKVYSFHEHFSVLVFQDEEQKTLGTYSDIGTPLTRTDRGYQMTDWFLDIWLSPNGTLYELDEDEFEAALTQGLLTESEATIARATFARLIDEAKQGIYPEAYL